jgi:hypothetical protein
MIVLVFGKETERRGVSVVMKDIMTGKNNNMVDKARKCREQAFAQHRGWTVSDRGQLQAARGRASML